jgi:hypothetical protein
MIVHFPVRLAAALWLTLAGTAGAASPVAVVELFTSQGCSSCPPADAILADLTQRPDVVAVTFPVDYWDYLGWKDTLAHPLFTARQRGYAHARGDRQVYTPQMIVNGTKPCIGSDRSRIEALTRGEGETLPVAVTTTERDGTVRVEIDAAPDRVAMAEVWVLPVARSRTVPIGRGENRGRTITYANVVRGLVRLGEWRGGPSSYEVSSRTARADADGYVILLQALEGTKPGVILGAAKSPGL